MDIKGLFTESQIGLLEEALNIGAGNAVTALSQILQCDTDMSFPVMQGFLSPLTQEIFQNIGSNCIAVEMGIVGELQGGLIVVIPEKDELKLTNLIRQAKEEQRGEGIPDISIILETSNILAGSFLTAIHDFCGLNIFHTVPNAEKGTFKYPVDMIQTGADDSGDIMWVITNQFIINKSNIRADLLIILSPGNIKKLIQSLEKIRVA